jgi:hypothetical protein
MGAVAAALSMSKADEVVVPVAAGAGKATHLFGHHSRKLFPSCNACGSAYVSRGVQQVMRL